VFLIQVINSFIAGILGVALPLMMDARHVNVEMMGFVFAAMPLIMQIGRMFFATVSDFWGRKLFFVSNGALGMVSGIIYYFAYSPLEFLFGKVVEGTKEGALWAVNRAYLLEKNNGHWRILVHLRTLTYVAFAVGSLLAGFFVVWFLFEGTMLLCTFAALVVFLLSFLLVSTRGERFNMKKALHFLDFRKKSKIFKISLILFFCMGLSFGFHGGFVIPMFLKSGLGFSPEMVGLIFGLWILLAGVFSYVFSRCSKIRPLILLNGVLYSLTFLLIGFLGPFLAATLLIAYSVVEGMGSVGQEGILSKICDKESYGIDIGLLMMGLHIGESLGLALSGVLISLWGFAVPFLLAALTYVFFYVGSYLIVKE
jgi:predicted MFS family arabinose efflux permease